MDFMTKAVVPSALIIFVVLIFAKIGNHYGNRVEAANSEETSQSQNPSDNPTLGSLDDLIKERGRLLNDINSSLGDLNLDSEICSALNSSNKKKAEEMIRGKQANVGAVISKIEKLQALNKKAIAAVKKEYKYSRKDREGLIKNFTIVDHYLETTIKLYANAQAQYALFLKHLEQLSCNEESIVFGNEKDALQFHLHEIEFLALKEEIDQILSSLE